MSVYTPAHGTTPPGTANERQAAEWVRRMFTGIAPRYDFLNHLLSFNVDRAWRNRLTRVVTPVLKQQEARILDLCCGTGDVLLDFGEYAIATVFGADFCHPMLVAAGEKLNHSGFRASLFEADALTLPIADNAFDAVSIAFGFRNLANYEQGLCELHRVLKPSGILAILEFSHPAGFLTKSAYGFYSRVVLPTIGMLVSGSREAYTYLPDSIRKFPQAVTLRDMMVAAGFGRTSYDLLSGGIAALHVGTKD